MTNFFPPVNETSYRKKLSKLEWNKLNSELKLTKPKNFRFEHNHPFEHQKTNTECGMYSLFFMITLLTNKLYKTPFKTTEQKIQFFKSKKIPDKKMEELRKKYYN